jgi:hypothetical protein
MCVDAKAPLLSRGGVAATSRKNREATADGADGVVLVKIENSSLTNTTPSARADVASHLFLTSRSHPSSAEEGSLWGRSVSRGLSLKFLAVAFLALALPACHKKQPVVVAPVVTPTPPPPRPLSALTLDEANREFAAANYSAAARTFARYLDLAPSEPTREDVLFRLALIYSLPVPELQDWSRAQRFFQQLNSEFPASPWKPVGQLLVSLKDQTAALSSEIQTLKSESAQIQAQIDSLRSNSTQQVAQIQRLNEKVDLLNSDIEKKEQKIKDLTSDIQRLIRIDSRTQSPSRN